MCQHSLVSYQELLCTDCSIYIRAGRSLIPALRGSFCTAGNRDQTSGTRRICGGPENVLILTPHLQPRGALVVPAFLSKYKTNEIKSWFRLAPNGIHLVSGRSKTTNVVVFFCLFQHFKRRGKSMNGKFRA